MITWKRIVFVLLVGFIWLIGTDLGDKSQTTGEYSFVTNAEAVVGRPLTPVSVAGVARRTARRTAVVTH